MKRFLDKAKSAIDSKRSDFPGAGGGGGGGQVPMQDQPSSIQPPTPQDITKYRYHHGTNLGSVFIMEKWLTKSVYHESAQGSSELAAAEARCKAEGVDKAREIHEKHWREYVSDSDLDWLRDVAKCTTVRLPIGYFTLGPAYCEGTPFQNVAGVYQNAWNCVKDLVARCHQRGLGVLIDVHGLPGGANAQDHSGTDSKKAEFWGSKNNRNLGLRCICFIAQQAKGMEGVAGIQIVNEAEHNAKDMYNWYEEVLKEAAKIDASMPIYVSDAWNLTQASEWSKGRNVISAGQVNPVVVDTHLYWCFGGPSKGNSPQDIAREVPNKLDGLKNGSVIDLGAADAVVGEYSCVLGEDSWAKGGNTPKDDLVRAFGNAESQTFQQKAGGSFFWTYRMDWMPGGEWGFKNMTEKGAITPPQSLSLSSQEVQSRTQHAQGQAQDQKQKTVSAHVHYWDSNHPGQYEHWRFEQGWDVGFNDAAAFFTSRSQNGQNGGDKIGMLDLWVLKRLKESGQSGKCMWEFEQGLRQGLRDFYGLAGI
ncbi:glycoside hydrolase [Acrodontium crateriforme]|uniref:Glycoside hydrolase n=1 Tax=Acrodontium crateriforme TaxID=150365 RepID=A0AAQ3LYE2_9PEZI|nr:glycoside hydrolase [Acrodontium crateriforme]